MNKAEQIYCCKCKRYVDSIDSINAMNGRTVVYTVSCHGETEIIEILRSDLYNGLGVKVFNE